MFLWHQSVIKYKNTKKWHINLRMSFFLCNFAAQNVITNTMPEISSFYGIAIYMYMSEHNPPHFHVKYQGYEAIITIKDGVITGSLPRRALRMVYEWLDQHEEELLANWERLGRSEEPIKIDPLQ